MKTEIRWHGNNCRIQESCMSDKTNGKSMMRKFTFIIWKYSSARKLLISKEKMITLQWRILAEITWSDQKVNITEIRGEIVHLAT
jgi:hypothetical protein